MDLDSLSVFQPWILDCLRDTGRRAAPLRCDRPPAWTCDRFPVWGCSCMSWVRARRGHTGAVVCSARPGLSGVIPGHRLVARAPRHAGLSHTLRVGVACMHIGAIKCL